MKILRMMIIVIMLTLFFQSKLCAISFTSEATIASRSLAFDVLFPNSLGRFNTEKAMSKLSSETNFKEKQNSAKARIYSDGTKLVFVIYKAVPDFDAGLEQCASLPDNEKEKWSKTTVSGSVTINQWCSRIDNFPVLRVEGHAASVNNTYKILIDINNVQIELNSSTIETNSLIKLVEYLPIQKLAFLP